MGEGGGVYSSVESEFPAIVTISNTTIAENVAIGGAGVIGGNGSGGGVYVEDTTACITHSTVRDNQALGGSGSSLDGRGVGGGFYIEDGDVGIANTLILANVASTSDDDVFGPFNPYC